MLGVLTDGRDVIRLEAVGDVGAVDVLDGDGPRLLVLHPFERVPGPQLDLLVLDGLLHALGQVLPGDWRLDDGLFQQEPVVHGRHDRRLVPHVHDQARRLAHGERAEHRILGQEHRGHVVLLEHQLDHLLPRRICIMRRLSQHHRVLLRVQAHLRREQVVAERLHGLPVVQDPVLERRHHLHPVHGRLERPDAGLELSLVDVHGVLGRVPAPAPAPAHAELGWA
mmetsp:Transcript_10584/g.29144  ORF Transcript_10584/g.29144 Transcript_10584/m.29144 type:complete len:224 (+) Transcript_10584:423-1094(+)